MELRPYQSKLVEDIRAEFRSKRKSVLCVSPTGSGKTVLFSYIAHGAMAKGHTVGIFVHRDELVNQVSKTLRQFDVPHGVIAAGGGIDRSKRVQVCSVQTYVKRLPQAPRFDLQIIDEAHHAIPGSTWNQSLDHSPDAHRLGVTATPQRLSGEGLGGTFSTLVLGPSVASLMDSGSLCRYRLFAPQRIEADKLHSLGGDFRRDESEAMMDKPTITGSAVQHYQQHCNGLPAVAFCVSVEHATHVAETFKASGYVAVCVDGKMDKDTRRLIMRDFEQGRIHVLTSCDLISEGYDCPGIFAAFLLRPTQSLGLYLQQVGRALRPFPNKPSALIFDHVGNWERHGLPDDDRLWTLAGREKRAKGEQVETVLNRRCTRCFAISPASAMKCVECGVPFESKPRTVEEVAGTLNEVNAAAHVKKVSPILRENGRARSLEALIEVGKLRGYAKPEAWAQHVMDARSRRP